MLKEKLKEVDKLQQIIEEKEDIENDLRTEILDLVEAR
jgi:hypothetical protein